MINLKTISISNFMSFGRGPTVLDLDRQKTTLVLGKNLDIGADGESANGVGKTTAIQAVIFAIYGRGIDKMKADEYINLANEKKLRVELTFEKGGKQYRIVRGRKPNITEFYVEEDGEESSLTRDSMKNTDEDIMRVIDVPYEVFMTTVFMSPHVDSFMGMTPAEQRNYMESLLSLDKLAERADTLKNLVRKDLQAEVKLIERDLESAETTNNKVQANLDRIKTSRDTFESERERDLKRFNEELGAIPSYDEAAVREQFKRIEKDQKQIDSIVDMLPQYTEIMNESKSDLKTATGLLDQLDSLYEKRYEFGLDREKNINTLTDKLNELESEEYYLAEIEKEQEIKSLNEQVKEYDRVLQQNQKEQKSLTEKQNALLEEADTLSEGTCPYCKQSHVDNDKLDSLVTEIETLTESIDGADRVIAKDEQSIKRFKTQIESITFDDAATKNLEKLRDLKNRISYIDQNIDNPYDRDISEIVDEYGDREEIAEMVALAEKEWEANKREHDRIGTLKKDFMDSLSALKTSPVIEGLTSENDLGNIEERKKSLCDTIEETKQKKNPYEGEEQHLLDMKVDVDEIKETKKELDDSLTHVNYLIKLLTDPKSFIRRNIVDQYIPVVNGKINRYTEQLGLSHVVEIKSDMTVSIDYMSRPVSYFMLSRGERLRLNVATSLAFRELMGMLGRNFNLLMIDELLDGSADRAGMYAIFKMINGYADNVMIVSHREEFLTAVDEKMTVVKRNGFSDVEID